LGAVHRDVGAVHPACPFRKKERDHVRDFVGRAEPTGGKVTLDEIVEQRRLTL
jgi:hypothetical protein